MSCWYLGSLDAGLPLYKYRLKFVPKIGEINQLTITIANRSRTQPDVLPNSSLGKVVSKIPSHPRIIPVFKWIITMANNPPKHRVVGPLPNGLFKNTNGGDPNHLSGMILQEIPPYSGGQRYCSGKWMSASCEANGKQTPLFENHGHKRLLLGMMMNYNRKLAAASHKSVVFVDVSPFPFGNIFRFQPFVNFFFVTQKLTTNLPPVTKIGLLLAPKTKSACSNPMNFQVLWLLVSGRLGWWGLGGV